MRQTSLLVLACAIALGGCGGPSTPPPRALLGVQSNEPPIAAVTLRVRPRVGSRFRTTLALEARAELFGRAIALDHHLVQEREVIERRADGTSVLAQRTVSGDTIIAMGEGPPRTETIPPEASAHTVVMDERGRSVEDAMFAAPPEARSHRELLRRLFDPLLDALAYPVEPLAPRQTWGSRGTHPLDDPDARGRLDHHLMQELSRVEGSGESTIAVIALRGEVRGEGTFDGDTLSGVVRVEGAYTVATADGLVRGMEVRVQGQITIGGTGMELPVEATLRYRAEPLR